MSNYKLAAVSALTAFIAASASAATVYNLSDNSILNPFQTTYQYGYEATPGGAFTAFDLEGTGPHSSDALTATGIATLGVYQSETDGSLFLQPGPAGKVSLIRFIAPSAGSYAIAGNFSALSGTTSSDVHVYVDGASAFDGSVGAPAPFDVTRTLSKNDTVDFIVGSGATADYQNDATSLAASLTLGSAAPEPATWAMMIVGFGFIGAATRRQTRAAPSGAQ